MSIRNRIWCVNIGGGHFWVHRIGADYYLLHTRYVRRMPYAPPRTSSCLQVVYIIGCFSFLFLPDDAEPDL